MRNEKIFLKCKMVATCQNLDLVKIFCRKIITIKVPKQRWSRKYNLLLDFYLFSFFQHFYIYVDMQCTVEAKLNEYCFYWCSNSQMYGIYWRREFCVLASGEQNYIYLYNVYQKITNLFIAKREEVRFFF